MKAVVAAFNQEKALVGAFSVITNLRLQLFEALVETVEIILLVLASHLSCVGWTKMSCPCEAAERMCRHEAAFWKCTAWSCNKIFTESDYGDKLNKEPGPRSYEVSPSLDQMYLPALMLLYRIIFGNLYIPVKSSLSMLCLCLFLSVAWTWV